METVSSRLLQEAIDAFSTLPGVGKRTAMRYVLHLLGREKDEIQQFAETVIKLRDNIRYCAVCGNISDTELCGICSNPKRDKSTMCIVESIRDVMAIESTGQYFGTYHVLGGLISPIDGRGPDDINAATIASRVEEDLVREVIIALKSTVEGDTTGFYIYRRIQSMGVNISKIARGIAIGDEIEYTDEVTLGRSILDRVPYENRQQTLVRSTFDETRNGR
ncbi:MAG: recombination mediator RecR [Bacteroidetes bacterium]|nr:recombination mediator RecR [Bacteroidota bacterium]MBU1717697.1 recombination mediator RecR [Bacteroidota bacterium]